MKAIWPTSSSRARLVTKLQGPPTPHPSTALQVMSLALIFVSFGMGVCAVLEALTTNKDSGALGLAAFVCVVVGVTVRWSTRAGSSRARDVFAAVGWTYVTITFFGALPYILAGTFAGSGIDFGEQLVNSIFESASGYSATGSTVLSDFESPGRGMLMYRQLSQWYGGMGIVVLAVAVLPFLGVGGLDLLSADAPGPTSDRLAPRVAETARRLWKVYLVFTAVMVIALFVVPGPSLYDSFAHAFTTTATGGFSPHQSSIGHFNSGVVEAVVIAGMLYGGTSFALHWRAWSAGVVGYVRDSEFRAYITLLFVAAVMVVFLLWQQGKMGFFEAVRVGVFNVVSLGTSTGYSNATGAGSPGDYVLWAAAPQMIILFLFVVGASSGSTSGGIKVMRLQVLFAKLVRSIKRSHQPRAIIAVKHAGVAVREDALSRMSGFFLCYVLLVCLGVVAVAMLGSNLETSIGVIFSVLGNMGPALAEAGPTANYSEAFTQPARLLLSVYMLIGRLEIFPMLLMFAAPYRAIRQKFRI